MTSPLTHQQIIEQDKKQLHPLQHPSRHDDPIVANWGQGVWIHTTDNRKILDGMAGLWNVNIGYGDEELPRVAYEQMKKLAYTTNFAGTTSPPSAALANKLAGLAHPTLNTTFFTSGGSESTDSSLKTARYYWRQKGRPDKIKIISRLGGYHGITMAATAATGIPKYHTMFGPLMPNIIHIPNPNPYRYPGDINDGETVGEAAARALEEAIQREGAETVAAFIAEPIQGAGGVIVPPDDYFPLVQEICRKYEVLLIIDEVITGFGRTGKMFAIKQYNIHPDILQFAKGVTSGYIPLGGVMISDEIRETIWNAPPDESWMHGYTYSGHAAACAVALRNIELIEERGLVDNSAAMGDLLLEGLNELTSEFPKAANARGKGLLCGFEMVYSKETRQPDPDAAQHVMDEALKLGVRVRMLGNNIAMSPPLVLNKGEVETMINALGNALKNA